MAPIFVYLQYTAMALQTLGVSGFTLYLTDGLLQRMSIRLSYSTAGLDTSLSVVKYVRA